VGLDVLQGGNYWPVPVIIPRTVGLRLNKRQNVYIELSVVEEDKEPTSVTVDSNVLSTSVTVDSNI
jgi:hypothetical protein